MDDSDTFRDPVDILTGAMRHLVVTRGMPQFKASQAFEILDGKREELVNGCIDDLLGESARLKGVRCECRRHPWWQPPRQGMREAQFSLSRTAGAERRSALHASRPVRNGKMAAAGDLE
jgi:hypothetical protein